MAPEDRSGRSGRRPHALAIAAASLVGAILLAMASCGADGPDAPGAAAPDGAASTTTDRASTTVADPSTTPTSTTVAGPSTTSGGASGGTPAVPESSQPPATRRSVESILIAGDSMARSLFPPVQAALETETDTETDTRTDVTLEWVIGTVVGDEMAKWARIFTDERPDVVVAHFMPWESATLQQGTVVDVSTDGWVDRYRADWVDPWIEMAAASGSTVVWVGPPLSEDPERSEQHQTVGDVWTDAIADANEGLDDDDPARITVIDSVELSAGPDGEFVAVDTEVDPPERLFNTDGVHWCPAGAARLADELIATLHALGIDTAADAAPAWQTAPWANDPESVRASEPNFGDGFAYPDGECPAAPS